MQFETLAQIQAHKFAGSYFGDSDAFDAIAEFAANDQHSMHERAEALREMGLRGMGLTREEAEADMPDADYVAAFMQDEADNA